MNLFMHCSRLVAAVVLAACTASPASAQTPSLAELAKKEEARRKALKEKSKVLSGDDLQKGPTAPPPRPAASDATEPKPSTKPDDKAGKKTEEAARDEAWWRSRITGAREELRRNEMFADALQTRINALSNDFAARDDPYQRARIAEERIKALAELERLKTDIELQKKAIAEIEEEARRAGVPPGWLR